MGKKEKYAIVLLQAAGVLALFWLAFRLGVWTGACAPIPDAFWETPLMRRAWEVVSVLLKNGG